MTVAAGRRRLSGVVLITALLSSCWALVSPLASVPDEPAHVIYAAAVVRGDLGTGAQGREVVVPAEVAVVGGLTCTAFHPDITAECRPPFEDRPGTAGTLTGAGRYPPLYYAIVGLPTLVGFGATQWVAMRLLSVMIGCLLLWVATRAWRHDPPQLAAGLVLALTPMTAFLLGSVNPNGAEIVAGVATTLAGCGLVDTLSRRERPRWTEAAAFLVPAAYLALARPSSYVLVVALSGVLGLLALPYLREIGARLSGLLVGGSMAAVALGLLTARLVALPATPIEGGVVAITVRAAARTTANGAAGWLQETVGLFGWRDHRVPPVLALLWLCVIAGLVLLALVRSGWPGRLSLCALILGATLAAPFFVLITLFRDGIGYQGRYAMALTQSVPVLAAALLARRPGERAWRYAPVGGVAFAALILAGSWLRYGVGLPLPPGPGTALRQVEWVPPAWPVVIVLLVAAAAVAGALARLPADPPRARLHGSMTR